MGENYEEKYDALNDDAEEDLRALEDLVNEAMENKNAMTESSLPKGFNEVSDEDDTESNNMKRYGDFDFKRWKEYDDGTSIQVHYSESTDSFGPDSSTVEINVKIPHTFTHNWDQNR